MIRVRDRSPLPRRSARRLLTVGLPVAGVLTLATVVALNGFTTVETAADETAIHVGSGPFEGKPVKGCVEAGAREINTGGGAFDQYFFYPENQRVFDFTGKEGSGAEPITVVSRDNQPLSVPGTINFSLATDCETLVEFHNNIGRRYQAYMVLGSNGEYQTGEGWARMLNLYIGRAADATLDRVAKEYTWRELYSDPAIKDELNMRVNDEIARLVNQQTDGDETFFVEFSALVGQPNPDAALVDALKAEETARAQAQATESRAVAEAAAAEAAAGAQVAQKEAELRVEQLNAAIEAAKIAPFGSVEAYNFNRAVEQGLNPWQPAYGAPISQTR